jgi:hypothetical protein
VGQRPQTVSRKRRAAAKADAPETKTAIKKAIEELKITDPEKQQRVIARLAR